MQVATPVDAVGIRELKNHLSSYVDRVQRGEEFVVTDRGRPVARLVPADGATDRLQQLIDAGLARPPARRDRRMPTRVRPAAPVSDLIIDERR